MVPIRMEYYNVNWNGVQMEFELRTNDGGERETKFHQSIQTY